jgi:Helix-turn-helix of DDE superfamily endonuclease
LRFDRISGLDAEQLDELEQRVSELLEKPWDQGNGRPKELTLREALVITCGYLRHNIIEEVWAEIFEVDQSTISRYITFLTPLIDRATAEFRPSADEAAEAIRDAIALVDGTLWPCWSWAGERALWAGKDKTTGHGSLIVTTLAGRVTFVSDPVPDKQHDMCPCRNSHPRRWELPRGLWDLGGYRLSRYCCMGRRWLRQHDRPCCYAWPTSA